MSDDTVNRKLTAILYADVAGYSRLTGADEVGTHKQLSTACQHHATCSLENQDR